MLDRFVRTIARNRKGINLLTGMAVVLSGVERLLSAHRPKPVLAIPQPVPPPRQRYRIYRTSDDSGFSYWILQGAGSQNSFALFDTWSQAMQEAERRLAAAHRIAQPIRSERLVPVAW